VTTPIVLAVGSFRQLSSIDRKLGAILKHPPVSGTEFNRGINQLSGQLAGLQREVSALRGDVQRVGAEVAAVRGELEAQRLHREEQSQIKNVIFDVRQLAEKKLGTWSDVVAKYIGATQLRLLLDAHGLASSRFDEIADKEYFVKTVELLEAQRAEASSAEATRGDAVLSAYAHAGLVKCVRDVCERGKGALGYAIEFEDYREKQSQSLRNFLRSMPAVVGVCLLYPVIYFHRKKNLKLVREQMVKLGYQPDALVKNYEHARQLASKYESEAISAAEMLGKEHPSIKELN